MERVDQMNTKNNKVRLKMVAVPATKGKMDDKFRSLIETIEKITGFKLEFHEADTYDEAIESLVNGKAQIAWLGQSAFHKAVKKVELDSLAIPSGDDESIYRTVLITPHRAKISSPNDLKGKRLILT